VPSSPPFVPYPFAHERIHHCRDPYTRYAAHANHLRQRVEVGQMDSDMPVPRESTTRRRHDVAELTCPTTRSWRSSSGVRSPTTSLLTPTLEPSGRRATMRSSTSEFGGSGPAAAAGCSRCSLRTTVGSSSPRRHPKPRAWGCVALAS
jgi:hypothetical protein